MKTDKEVIEEEGARYLRDRMEWLHDRAPFELLHPRLFKDGNQWCCLYGENLQEGIAGFGSTPDLAVLAFCGAYEHEKAK